MSLRDRNALVKAWNEGHRPEFVMFWGRKGNDTSTIGPYVFSQWHFSKFEHKGHTYPTAEHWMMARKALLMGDQQSYEAILACGGPVEAKAIGRRVRPWDQAKWDEHKFQIVVAGSYVKFQQNPDLRDYLLSTGDKVLVEASPEDRVWGIGLRREDPRSKDPNRWRGQNLLGFALMEARSLLRENGAA